MHVRRDDLASKKERTNTITAWISERRNNSHKVRAHAPIVALDLCTSNITPDEADLLVVSGNSFLKHDARLYEAALDAQSCKDCRVGQIRKGEGGALMKIVRSVGRLLAQYSLF